MRIAVVGLWHLGLVTAACLAAEGHEVFAIDDASIAAAISAGRLPIDEPGLADLITANRQAGRLTFAANPHAAAGAELIWICYDTPIDDDDRADVASVIERAVSFLAAFAGPAVVAISSQLPVGTVAQLRHRLAAPRFTFACIPENLRLGSAIAYFRAPDRFVVGVDDSRARAVIERAIGFAPALIWTGIESAEVVKHAINAFLATSVVFANEIATLCERVGADARDVERGLKSDVRIGPKAYIRAGEAFAGGTLARDLAFLDDLGTRNRIELAQLRATARSNERHRGWTLGVLEERLETLAGKRIALLGLVYKPGTNTLRASSAVALARKLAAAGAGIVGYDPAIDPSDTRLGDLIELAPSAQAALAGADAAVVATSWPEFCELEPAAFEDLRAHLVVDEARFLEGRCGAIAGLTYVAFGRKQTRATAAR